MALESNHPSLEVLVSRLASLERAHTDQAAWLAALGETNARLAEELDALRTTPTAPSDAARAAAPRSSARRFPPMRQHALPHDALAPAARTSRRGMLGTAAKVAAATAGAGVILAARGGTAHASATSTITASGSGNWALEADGTSQADGIHVSSDQGSAIVASGTGSNGGGIYTSSDSSTALYATSNSGWAIYAANNAASTTGTAVSVEGTNGAAGLTAQSFGGGNGVVASSDTATAVYATSSARVGGYGVYGRNDTGLAGSIGVLGQSFNATGGPASGIGVKGITSSGDGVYGSASSGYGMVAVSASGTGLSASSSSGSAIIASSGGVGYGLYLTAPSGWAIGCNGRLRVLGNSVGTATLPGGSTTLAVPSSACSSSSLVMLTPTSDPLVRIWATAAPGVFTIHASGPPASNVTFTYFLIN